jgi:hypothetical protein
LDKYQDFKREEKIKNVIGIFEDLGIKKKQVKRLKVIFNQPKNVWRMYR